MDALRMALDTLLGLPPWLIYLTLAGGALLENLLPPVPADTFVVVGGLLAVQGEGSPDVQGHLSPALMLTLIWLANVGGAIGVYLTGRRYGTTFFETGAGRLVLNRRQLRRLGHFYERYGGLAIFFARFLPGLRAVIPGFAGVSRLGFWRVTPPLAVASGIWYGLLMWAGVEAGRNMDRVARWFTGANRGLLVVALIAIGAGLVWWIRTRALDDDGVEDSRA